MSKASLTPRQRILLRRIRDGLRRFYRAVEAVEKELDWTVDVYVEEEALWWEPGDEYRRQHDAPYVGSQPHPCENLR